MDYFLFESPIGLIKIAGTAETLTEIAFLDAVSSPQLPDYALMDGNSPIARCATQLSEFFEGKRKTFDLPLGQTGTAFQQEVWRSLEKIPFGKTRSYMEIAKSINKPKAMQAVGAANGQNRLAIVVPCHRVIGAGGMLTGYAGGLWRKTWLLEHENRLTDRPGRLF